MRHVTVVRLNMVLSKLTSVMLSVSVLVIRTYLTPYANNNHCLPEIMSVQIHHYALLVLNHICASRFFHMFLSAYPLPRC